MDKFNKPKLSVARQVVYLETKGVKFNICDKESAIDFLTNNSYLFKIKAYAKNYTKRDDGTYINLEFAYLKELSTIDMHLRRFILTLTLNIEHLLKTKLLRDFNEDGCDGYSIVDDYLNANPKQKNYFLNYSKHDFTAKDNIINKYRVDLSIWNLIEILEFKNFTNFCDFYYKKFPNQEYIKIKNMLTSVQFIRNAAAHNNCLINNLNPIDKFRPTYQIMDFLNLHLRSSKKSIENKMKNPFINNFLCSFLIFNVLCKTKPMKKATVVELMSLLKRARKHKGFYESNNKLTSTYAFLVKSSASIKRNFIHF